MNRGLFMSKPCAIRANVVKRVKRVHSLIKFTVSKVKSRLLREPAELFVIGMIVGFIVFFSYYSWLRYLTFRDAHDFANLLQSLWGLTHGMSGAQLKLPLSSPIVYILAIPYYFYPHAWSLFVLQAAGLALGALPLFWIARDKLKSELAGIFLAAAYLVYPAVGNQNYAQWHAQSFVPLLLLLAFYFYYSHKWKPYVISIVSLLSIQIFVPIVLLFLTLYQSLAVLFVWIKEKRIVKVKLNQKENSVKWKNLLAWPLTTFVAAIVYILIINIVMSFTPDFLGWSSQSLGSNVPYQEYPSISALIFFYLSHPSSLIAAIQADWSTKYQFLNQLFSPVAYLSLFDPPTLFLSLPWISAGFLTSTYGSYYYSIYNQNVCYIFPFVFISAVYGIKRLNQFVSNKVKVGRAFAMIILISTLISALTFSVVSPMNAQQNNAIDPSGWPQVNQHHIVVMKILSFVPPDASIYVDDTLASNEHIAQRKFMFVRGPQVTEFPEYVLLDFDYPLRLSPRETQFPSLSDSPTLEEMLSKYYGIYASADGVELWKYDYSGEPVYYEPLKRVYGPNDVILSYGDRAPMNGTFFQQVLVAPTSNSPHWFWGPCSQVVGHRVDYIALPAGDYEITFRLRLLNVTTMTGRTNDSILLIRLVQNYGSEFVENADRSSRLLYAKDFLLSTWQNFTMFFRLTSPRWGVAFQLYNPNAAMQCEYVALTQLSPVPKPLFNGIEWEEMRYTPVAFIYGNITKDVVPGQAIFQSTPLGNESSLLPFHFADGQITMPFSNIQFFRNLMDINTTSDIFVDGHLNASFKVLSTNDKPYLNLIIYNKTAVSINSPYTAVFHNKMDMELSTNSSVLFGFNSPEAEGIFTAYFPTLVLHILDTDNLTHTIHIQYGFLPPTLAGLPNIYYYIHPTNSLDNRIGFSQMKLVDIISSVNQSWVPHRLTTLDYQGTFITTTALASSYSVEFNFYAAAITESPVTVNAISANGTILQAVPLNGTTYTQNVNGETDIGMKFDVSGLEASLMHNVSMPFYYHVNASVNTLSELEQQYSWDLSIPEGPTYAANILFTLNGIRSTAVKNLTLNDISVKAAIEGWSAITVGNLTNTITRGSKLYLQALVYLTTLTPEAYYIGDPTITSIPFQDMNVIMGISLVPVLITGVWYVVHNRQNRKLRCGLLNKIRNYVHWRSDK